ncbi:hypothetical protein [Paenibacillus humicus]|uniref:hypothetical protein n=1 Tax=Paenibacillus humicus TaxID=412861 RepID=UPI003D2A06DA
MPAGALAAGTLLRARPQGTACGGRSRCTLSAAGQAALPLLAAAEPCTRTVRSGRLVSARLAGCGAAWANFYG